MSFQDLKKNRQSAIDALNAEISKYNQKTSVDKEDDDRFWYPDVDKAGNGNAIIRFLPAIDGEFVPFVRYWQHGFQGTTGLWYIEMCPTTKGKKCPMCDENRQLWNSGKDADKKLASKQKRQLRFITNILVIKDPANPENEGQVKLYKFGAKVWDKINELMHPTEGLGEESINPFDFWEGAPFKLKIRQVEGYRNYDKSEFANPEVLNKDDSYIEEIWKKEYPLLPFVDDSLFKDEAVLREKMIRVLGLAGASASSIPSNVTELLKPKKIKSKEAKVEIEEAIDVDDDTDEMDENFFKKLAAQD